MNTARRWAGTPALLFILLLAMNSLSAATKKWDGGGSANDWVSSLNWSPENVPAPGDDIVLDNSLVSIPSSMVINGGVVSAQTLTFSAGFNATSTTLIGNGASFPSFLVFGSSPTVPSPLVQVNSSIGTITFERRNGGTADLKFELGAPTAMDIHAGATLVINCEISGAHGLTKSGPGLLRLGGINIYTGPTVISQGTFGLVTSGATQGSIANSSQITVNSGATFDVSTVPFVLQSGQILAGSGLVNGSVTAAAGSTLLAGPAGAASTLTLNNNLNLEGATLVFDLANVTTEGSGVNDEILVSGDLNLTGDNVINLNYLNGSLPPGTYKLLNYGGTKSGSFVLGTPYQNVTLDQTTTPHYVTLVVSAPGSSVLNLKWQGDGGANVWDLVTPANWMNGASASGYYDPANVTIDDSGSFVPSINLVANVDPRSLTVSSTHNYTITGVGQIGSVPGLNNPLAKSGSGILTLETSNDFSGGVDIQAGTLRIGNANAIPVGAGRGDVNVAGTLDLNAFSIALNGLNGAGTVDNQSGAGSYTLTLGSNHSSSSFSGVLRNTTGTLGLTKTGSGMVVLGGNSTFTGPVTVNDGAVRISHGNALGSTAGNTTVAGAGTLGRLELVGGITVNENLVLAMKFGVGSGSKDLQTPHIRNISGDNTLNGTFTLNSGGTFWTFQSDAGKLILTKPLSSTAPGGRPLLLQGAGDGEIKGPIQNGSGMIALVKSGTGTWTLSGTNAYSQSTTINAGILRIGHSNAIPTGIGKSDVTVDGILDLNGNSITINGLSGAGIVDNQSGAAGYVFTVGDNNRSGTFSGTIRNTSGTLGVGKIGTGTITLSGVNTYSGDTTITQGTLKVGVANAIPDGSGKGNVVLNGTLDIGGNSETINGLSGNGTVDNSVGGTPLLTVGNNNASSTFDGIIGGGFVSVTKVGSGTLTLSGNHTYTGNTIINGGTVLLNGSIDSPAVTVNASGTLGGNGVINGSVSVESGGTLSPGASIGTLSISDSLSLAGNALMQINKTAGVLTSDLVTGVSALTYGGTLTVSATGDALALNDSFNLFDAGSFNGTFASYNLPSLPPCLAWDTSTMSVDGTIKVVHETVPPVIGTIAATEVQSGTVNVKDCANSVQQGTVNISVQASDNCSLAAPPVIALTNGASTATAVFVNQSPSGTYNYTWAVTAGTATGTWTATTAVTDSSGNTTRVTFTLCFSQSSSQVTGQIELQGFVGTTRAVTFVVTSSANTPLTTNTQTLTFSGSPRTATYTLNVPSTAANLSAKSAWTLRKRLPLTFVSGQAVANFNGSNRLLGGDVTGDNRVNVTDNNTFKIFNGKSVSTVPAAAQADITGNGVVNILDSNVLKPNLGKLGEAQ